MGSNNKTDEGTMSAMSLKYFMFVVHHTGVNINKALLLAAYFPKRLSGDVM